MSKKVLVTYAWVRSSYAAMRNLVSHGVDVYVADSNRTGMCQFSKLKSGFDQYASHYKNEEAFVANLLEIVNKRKIDLIFPSHNETEIIAKFRDQFNPDVVRLIPEYEHCKLFNNKKASYDYVTTLGVSVPKRFVYSHPNELQQSLMSANAQSTVIKTLTGNSSKGVFYASSPEESVRIVSRLIRDYNLKTDRYPQVEERITGNGFGVSVLYWHGKYIAGFTHRRLREKIVTGGTSTLRQVEANSAIETATRNIFEGKQWHGMAMAEFKVCPKSGKYWFIEVNPRMWGSISLAINAGVEFPYLGLLCANEGPNAAIDYHTKTPTHKEWIGRWLMGDLLLGTKELAKLRPRQAYNHFFKTPYDSLDDFNSDDIGAFIGQITKYSINTLGSLSMNPKEKGMIK